MKQLANFIKVIPVHHVQSVSGTEVTPKSGFELIQIYTRNDIDPDDKLSIENGNQFYKQSLKVVCELSAANRRLLCKSKVILILYDSDLQPYVVGTKERGVSVQLTPYLNNMVEINFQYESLSPIFE